MLRALWKKETTCTGTDGQCKQRGRHFKNNHKKILESNNTVSDMKNILDTFINILACLGHGE